MYINTMLTTYNTAVTVAASEIFGKGRRMLFTPGSPETFLASVMRAEFEEAV